MTFFKSRIKISTYTFTSMIFSLVTLIFYWAVSELFSEKSIFYLGAPFALSAFILSYTLLNLDKEVREYLIDIVYPVYIPRIFFAMLTIASILAVLFVPPYDCCILEWTNIPLVNWLRYLASILLAFFLPGYFLLKSLDRQNSIELSATIPLSYILSIFITFATGFSLLITQGSISSLAGYLLILINLVLMVIYCARPSSQRYLVIQARLIDLSALSATLLVNMVGNIYVMSKLMPLAWGDMWRHHAQSLQYLKGFPIHAGILIPSYPYLFHISLAVLFQLSGLPSPITYHALFILSFVAVLSFYSFAHTWCSRKSTNFIVMVLISLLGFGSLYVLNLKIQNEAISLSAAISEAVRKTYDIFDIMVISPMLSNVVPVLYIGMPALFMFMYLLKKNFGKFENTVLFSLLVAVAYLGHIVEAFFMALILLMYAITLKERNVMESMIGGFLGLLIVSFLDALAPAKLYVWRATEFFSSNSTVCFLATSVLFALSYIMLLIRRSYYVNSTLVYRISEKALPLLPWLVIYTYLFSLVTWMVVLPGYDAIKTGHYNFTPFFVWPVRFGAVGLLFVSCLVLYRTDVGKVKHVTFFLSLAVIGIVLEQLANYFPFYPAYRFSTLTLVGVIFMTAYLIIESLTSARNKTKKILMTAFILAVLLPSMLTTTFYYYRRGINFISFDEYELDALDFLRRNLPSNSSVLTFTVDSANKLETFAGIHPLQVMQRWSYVLLNVEDPAMLLYMLGSSNTEYMYVSREDSVKLEKAGIIKKFIENLPIVFNNSKVRIYKLPRLVPPSQNARLAIINLFDYTTDEFLDSTHIVLTLSLPSLSGVNYRVISFPVSCKHEKVNFTVIDDMGSEAGISISEGSGEVSLVAENALYGNSSIGVSNIKTDENGRFAIKKTGKWDLSHYEVIGLWVKVPKNIVWAKVNLRSGAAWATWRFRNLPANKWVQLRIELDSPESTSKVPLNLSRIDAIEIGFNGLPNTSYELFQIDSITAWCSTSYCYLNNELIHLIEDVQVLILPSDPRFDVYELIHWAEMGGTMLVLATEGEPNFIGELLGLRLRNQSILSDKIVFENINERVLIKQCEVPQIVVEDPRTKVLAYYIGLNGENSPFILYKKLGSGGILYVRLPPTVLSDTETVTRLFDKMLEIGNLTIQRSNFKLKYFPVYRTLEKTTYLDGLIEVKTKHVVTPPMNVKRLVIKENGTEELSDVTIRLESIGDISIVLNGSLSFSSNTTASYLVFSGKSGQRYYLKVDNGSLRVVVLNKNKIHLINRGSIIFETSEFSALIRLPSISVNGKVVFESARIPTSIDPPSYKPLAGVVRGKMEVIGRVKFDVQFASKGIMLISDFDYSGKVKGPPPEYQKLEIPWIEILLSPLHMSVIVLVILGIYISKKKGDKMVQSYSENS